MMVISYKTIAKLLLGTFIVSALPLSTVAAVRCEAVFGNSTYLRDTVAAARDLNKSVLDFLEVYQKNPQELTTDQVRAQVNSFGRKADAYFKEAGIEAQYRMETIKFKNLKDLPEFVMSYPVFTLKGARSGDEVSRMMYGVQSNPHFNKRPITFDYDTLYLFRNQDSLGHYESGGNKIYVGPHVVTQALAGFSSTLRHEVQHYFEQMKIYDGKMTMARIAFSTGKKQSVEPYDNYLRMDELETHLRDVRILLNLKARIAKDKTLEKNLDAATMAKIKGARSKYIQQKMEIMTSILKNSETMLNHFRNQMRNQKPESYDVTQGHGDPTALYFVDGLPYKMIQVNTYGIYNKPSYELTNADLQNGLQKIFDWQWTLSLIHI